jgi:hypothetical protein
MNRTLPDFRLVQSKIIVIGRRMSGKLAAAVIALAQAA